MNKVKVNRNVINVLDDMNNTMVYLFNLDLASYYKTASIQFNDGHQVITWANHKSDRANCGSSFTSLSQYKHILETRAFHCILFDGSIIRSSFKFEGNILKNHTHLWWPSPYGEGYITIDEYESQDEFESQNNFEEFITSPDCLDILRLRSPIRIDFDPENESSDHPLVHMHTQHYDSRINVNGPICFSKFIRYIFENYYPHKCLDFKDWTDLKFTHTRASN